MSDPSHIVCFAPYTDWSIHSARQVTILHGLRQRGATVSYVTCDGVFSDCDLFQKATGAEQGRQPNSCLVCQASVASRLAAWGMPYRWLGNWLTTQDRLDVGRWLSELRTEDYPCVEFKGWHLGAWVQSSVRTDLRCTTMDMADQNTATTYQSYLYSGALAALALDRLFEEENPDAQLLFNGRMAPTRIALELGKAKGIRTIVEERAAVNGRLILFDNVNCLDVAHVDQLWRHWKDQPLSRPELDEIETVLEERRSGGHGEVSVFSVGQQPSDAVCDRLSLDRTKPIWVLFTSSLDEIADKPDVKSVFGSQKDWIDATLSYAERNSDIQVIIRVHPNVGGTRALGDNTEEVTYFQEITRRAPDNVSVVQPDDDVSSYSLIELCDLALVWYSTIGIEAAAMGRRVVRASGFMLEGRDFILAPQSPSAYPDLLESLKQKPSALELLDIAVSAWRFAYIWFIRRTIAFPLVSQPKWYVGEMAWNTVDDLQPGRDANLDRICDMVLNESGIHKMPRDRTGVSASDERTAIEHMVQSFMTRPVC